MTSENMNMSVTNSMDLSGRNPHNDTMVSNGNGEEVKGAAAAGGDPRDQAQGQAIKPKRQLQRFYDAVLDKQNQNFLYRLVKQSCMLQKDDKSKE